MIEGLNYSKVVNLLAALFSHLANSHYHVVETFEQLSRLPRVSLEDQNVFRGVNTKLSNVEYRYVSDATTMIHISEFNHLKGMVIYSLEMYTRLLDEVFTECIQKSSSNLSLSNVSKLQIVVVSIVNHNAPTSLLTEHYAVP